MLGKDHSVDMVYLEFAKAFDKVDHGILLHKLKDLGITGRLGVCFFFTFYLTGLIYPSPGVLVMIILI